jgi:uncharacterized membrane protein
MRIVKLLLKRETVVPVLALTFASIVSVGLVFARIAWTGHLRYAFLVWNLFLAWLPLVFSLLASQELQHETVKRWRFVGLAGVWLLFFPNAPYILTDVIHLKHDFFYLHFWLDLTLILSCALTGLVLGFVSLYIMQSLVRRLAGRLWSWIFVAVTAGLSSFGVYVGRFLRFNSWDVFLRPGHIYRGLDAWKDSPMLNHVSAAFLVLFALFLFISYVMLYALTHLQELKWNPEIQSFPNSRPRRSTV